MRTQKGNDVRSGSLSSGLSCVTVEAMSEPVLNVQQAAAAAGVSRSTIYRHLETLMEHGATRDATGTRIPFSALIGAGLASRTSPPEASPATRAASRETRPATAETGTERELRERLAEAEARIRELEHARALAEAIAVERNRVIEVQSRALRLLEAGPAVSHGETTDMSHETESETGSATRENPPHDNGNPGSETGVGHGETVPETENETSSETRVGHGETVPETGGDGPVTASEPASAGNAVSDAERPFWRRLWPF